MSWPANRILRVLQEQGAPAMAQEIADATGLTLQQIWAAAETLVRNKLAGRPSRGVYAITAAGRAAIAEGKALKSGPKGAVGHKHYPNTFRERLWLVLRIEKKGTIGDFVSLLRREGEDEEALTGNATKYLGYLCRAGYVGRLPGRTRGTALTSNGYVRYLLLENTGPKTPAVRKGGIFDPNTGREVPFREVPREP